MPFAEGGGHPALMILV